MDKFGSQAQQVEQIKKRLLAPASPRESRETKNLDSIDIIRDADVVAQNGHSLGENRCGFPEEASQLRTPLFQLVQESSNPSETYLEKKLKVWKDPQISLKQKLRAIPILGYMIAWLNAIIKLAVTRHHHTLELQVLRTQNMELFEKIVVLNQRLSDMRPLLEQSTALTDERIRACDARLGMLEEVKASTRLQRYDALDIGTRLMKIEQAHLERRLKQLTQLLQIEQRERYQNLELLRTLKDELNLHGLAANGGRARQPETKQSYAFDRDRFYKDFEDRFRGSRDEIKQRLHAYLPLLSEISQLPVSDRRLFVDVGCGRGEWLELLAEREIPSLGIDLNQAMVENCVNLGLAAKVEDAMTFLWQQEKESLSGVSGFHIIEHLSFEKLIELFDAAYQALAPNGLVIFETPNPENLIVGACNFYYDPTHIHPIVPEVAKFIAEQRGFSRVEIKRLHPFPSDYQMPGDSATDQALNKFLFSAQDYAVVAWK